MNPQRSVSLNEHEARRRRSIDQKQSVFVNNMRRIDSMLSAFEHSNVSYDDFMSAFPPIDSAEFKALDFGATMQRLMQITQYTRSLAAERGKVDRRAVYEDARDMLSNVINGEFVNYLTSTNVNKSKYVVIKRGDEVVGTDGCASCWSLITRTIDAAQQVCDIGLVHGPCDVNDDSAVTQMLDDIFDEIKDNPNIIKLEIIFACGVFNSKINAVTYINDEVAKLNEARDNRVSVSYIKKNEHPQTDISNQLTCGVVVDYHGNIYIRWSSQLGGINSGRGTKIAANVT
jgi:hypothetical protein